MRPFFFSSVWRNAPFLLALSAAGLAAGDASAMSRQRQEAFAGNCTETWVKTLPNMGRDGAKTMCGCIRDLAKGYDDALSDEEIMDRVVGPADMESQPEVFTRCIEPALVETIGKTEEGREQLRHYDAIKNGTDDPTPARP